MHTLSVAAGHITRTIKMCSQHYGIRPDVNCDLRTNTKSNCHNLLPNSASKNRRCGFQNVEQGFAGTYALSFFCHEERMIRPLFFRPSHKLAFSKIVTAFAVIEGSIILVVAFHLCVVAVGGILIAVALVQRERIKRLPFKGNHEHIKNPQVTPWLVAA